MNTKEFEYISESNVQNDETFEYWRENGKQEINELLWKFLPNNTTLKEADDIALKIFEMIDGWWEFKR